MNHQTQVNQHKLQPKLHYSIKTWQGILILVVVAIIMGGIAIWISLDKCQKCYLTHFWTTGACDTICFVEPIITGAPEFCRATFLEDCDGKRVEVVGEIVSSKGTSLCSIEGFRVKYGWGCDGPGLMNPEYHKYAGKKVKIIGIVHKGGKAPEPLSQAYGEGTPTTIEVEHLEVLESVPVAEEGQWILIPADAEDYAPGCIDTGGMFGGCFGKHIIKNARISKNIPCLKLEINNCNGGIIEIRNQCQKDVTINGKVFPYRTEIPVNKSYDLVVTRIGDKMHIINKSNRLLDESVAEELGRLKSAAISPIGQELTGKIGQKEFTFTFTQGELQKSVECLVITLGRMTGGDLAGIYFLSVSNYCDEGVEIEDFSFEPYLVEGEIDYFTIDVVRKSSGELIPQLAEGNFATYLPDKDDVIELTIRVGEDEAALQYTKTGSLCN